MAKRKATTTKAASKKTVPAKGAAPASSATPKKKAKAAAPANTKRVAAIDAAAKLLAESKTPMTTSEMVRAMSEKGLWSSPAGKTPERTLYSAILREIGKKGKHARFTKTERGKFALTV